MHENSGLSYRAKKLLESKVSGYTEITADVNALLPADRLDREPFVTLFDEFTEHKIEHQWTDPNQYRGRSLVRLKADTIRYEDIGTLCSMLPSALWKAYEMEKDMTQQ